MLTAPRATLLPHIGSATIATRTRMARLACQGVCDVLAGRTPPNVVVPAPQPALATTVHFRGLTTGVNQRGSKDTIRPSFERLSGLEGGGVALGPDNHRHRVVDGDGRCSHRTARKPALDAPRWPLWRRHGRRRPASRRWPTSLRSPARRARRQARRPAWPSGDDGGHAASIIVTQNGGASWSDSTPPVGVTTLSTVSCPSTCRLLRRRRLRNHEVDQRRGELDHSGLRRFRPNRFPASTLTSAPRLEASRSSRRPMASTWNAQTPPPETDSLSAVSCSSAITCVAVGVVDGNPSIVGTANGVNLDATLDQPSRQFPGVSCLARHRPPALRLELPRGGGATSPEHVNFSDLATDHLNPRGSSSIAIACPNETTCIAVGTNLSSTPYVVGTSNNGSTWSLQTPPANAVDLTGISCSAARRLHRGGQHRQPRGRFHDHGHDDGRAVMDGADPATGNESLELGFVPQHHRMLRRRTSTRSWPRSTRDTPGPHRQFPPTSMASTPFRVPRPPIARRWDSASSEAPSSSAPSNAGATWTSEPVPSGVGILTGSLVCEPCCMSCRERLRHLLAQHHRDGQRRRNMGTQSHTRESSPISPGSRARMLCTAPPWACRPADRVR